MKVTADTNVLIRTAVADDPEQTRLAVEALRGADVIAVTLPSLCEFVWVLARWYKFSSSQIAIAMRLLINGAQVQTDRLAVQAGLAMLDAGGDFADGVIAFEGRRLGGTVFLSFDRAAVSLIASRGADALLLSA
jgi:predicted nucleic-acid-binding protein